MGDLKVLTSRRVMKDIRKGELQLGATNFAEVIFKDSVGEAIADAPSVTSDYVYIPPEVGPDIYVGSIVALVPIVWATYEFVNRIRIQKECLVCSGSGLVNLAKNGNVLKNSRKCWNCGGFLPWLGWKVRVGHMS